MRADDVPYFKTLLQDDALANRVLDGELNPNTSGIGLCPDEMGVNNPDFL
jgi:hypothetical protein